MSEWYDFSARLSLSLKFEKIGIGELTPFVFSFSSMTTPLHGDESSLYAHNLIRDLPVDMNSYR